MVLLFGLAGLGLGPDSSLCFESHEGSDSDSSAWPPLTLFGMVEGNPFRAVSSLLTEGPVSLPGWANGLRRFSPWGADSERRFFKSLSRPILAGAAGQTIGSLKFGYDFKVASGQPFALDILQALWTWRSWRATLTGLYRHLYEGAPLGVDGPTLADPDIWPSKQERTFR